MGGKRTRKREHILLYFTCILTSLWTLPACTHLPKGWLGEHHFDRADSLLNMTEYGASLMENEYILERSPKSLGDQALYRIGLIYVHPENEAADEQKALEAFKKILKEYPESPLKEWARVWVLTITKMWHEKKIIRELNEKISKLNEKISKLKKNDEEKQERIQILNSAQGDSKEIIKQMKHRIASLEVEIQDLKSQMEKLKKIDLRIEEEKRKLFP